VSGTKHQTLQSPAQRRRLIVLCLVFALGFAILVLYIGSLEAILFAVLVITAMVVAATRDDLTVLRADRNLVLFMVAVAVAVTALSASFVSPYSGVLFYTLVGASFALLSAYIAMRRSQRLEGEAQQQHGTRKRKAVTREPRRSQ
jgi:hypothetical protein